MALFAMALSYWLNCNFKGGRILELKKTIRNLLLAILVLSTLALSGCIYSHNYDENGDEMNKEQVDEAMDNIRESIESEINNSLSSD